MSVRQKQKRYPEDPYRGDAARVPGACRGRGEVHHWRRQTDHGNDLQADIPADRQNHRPAWRDAACVPAQLPDLCADRRDGYQDAAGHRRTRGYPNHHEPVCASAKRQNRGDRKARDRPVCAKNVQGGKSAKPCNSCKKGLAIAWTMCYNVNRLRTCVLWFLVLC